MPTSLPANPLCKSQSLVPSPISPSIFIFVFILYPSIKLPKVYFLAVHRSPFPVWSADFSVLGQTKTPLSNTAGSILSTRSRGSSHLSLHLLASPWHRLLTPPPLNIPLLWVPRYCALLTLHFFLISPVFFMGFSFCFYPITVSSLQERVHLPPSTPTLATSALSFSSVALTAPPLWRAPKCAFFFLNQNISYLPAPEYPTLNV